MFPQEILAQRFGSGDATYAWNVFHRHLERLTNAGFQTADRILEIGPGRNLGTALLFWAYCRSQGASPVYAVCWDVFKNATPETGSYWQNLAQELLKGFDPGIRVLAGVFPQVQAQLEGVSNGTFQPGIDYRVCKLEDLENATMAKADGRFGLVYSQAAIEHIWEIEAFWETMERLTAPGGWHSHRIDLSDHGKRETNYIEMLEWSPLSYWLAMRFVPGAINRWRACHHLKKLESLGFSTLSARQHLRDRLPVPLHSISAQFRDLPEAELRCTALDIVSKKTFNPIPGASLIAETVYPKA